MHAIQNYEIKNILKETRGAVVYLGNHAGSTDTVIIKALKVHMPSPSDIARFKQEYTLIKTIGHEGVIKTFDVITYENTFAIIQEDFQGVSIKDILVKERKIRLPEFLDIAIRIAEAVGQIHQMNIIHKDIKPHNILINREKGAVKLTDFGIAALLTHEDEEIYNPEVIEGTLCYFSPEKTGRMNRNVDCRTDLY